MLASRFAPPEARRQLIALYALNYEIAHTAETVTQATLGDMRRPLFPGLFLPAKLVKYRAIRERYGKAEWMRQIVSKGHRLLDFLERLVGVAQQP